MTNVVGRYGTGQNLDVTIKTLEKKEWDNRYRQANIEHGKIVDKSENLQAEASRFQHRQKAFEDKEQRKDDHDFLGKLAPSNNQSRKVQQTRTEFGKLINFKDLNAHLWVMTEKGILKAINLDDRSAYNYYKGTQPNPKENFQVMCTPRPDSIIGCMENGSIEMMKAGQFHKLCNQPGQWPAYIEQLPSYYEHKLYLYPEFSPSIRSHQLVIINKDCSITYNDKYVSSFHLGSGGSAVIKKYITAGCIQQKTATSGGIGLSPTRKDLATGLTIWEAAIETKKWWDNKSLENVRYMLTDNSTPADAENCFFVSYNQGIVRKFDVRANTGGRAVLECKNETFVDLLKTKNESWIKLKQMKTSPHELMCFGSQNTVGILDTRKFVSYSDYTDRYLDDKRMTAQGMTGSDGSTLTGSAAHTGRSSYIKSYKLNSLHHSSATALSFDFLGRTKSRPGLIACGATDALVRIFDASNAENLGSMFLRSAIKSCLLVPGISCYQEKKDEVTSANVSLKRRQKSGGSETKGKESKLDVDVDKTDKDGEEKGKDENEKNKEESEQSSSKIDDQNENEKKDQEGEGQDQMNDESLDSEDSDLESRYQYKPTIEKDPEPEKEEEDESHVGLLKSMLKIIKKPNSS